MKGYINPKKALTGKISRPCGGNSDHVTKKYTLKATEQKSITYIKNLKSIVQVLTDDQKNLTNWNKNMQSYPVFENVYADGSNDLQYQGGAGSERIYIAVSTEVGSEYSFEFDFKSSTGFSCSYGSSVEYVFVTPDASIVSGTGGFSTSSAIGYAVLDNIASDTTKHYTVGFTATSNTTYLSIDLGYIVDGVQINLYFSDLSLYKTEYEYKKEVTK